LLTIFYSSEGNPMNISCDVSSNPPAAMLWRFTIAAEGTANTRVYNSEGPPPHPEFILAQADVPSNPYSVRLSAVSQRLATVTFMKPDSHGGVPISHYLVQYKELTTPARAVPVHTTVVQMSLEPNTTYEVRVAAVNGKG
ncbi:hypothetical protein NHX12_015140, partial [Muraenolepis orangiensis]